MIFVPLRIPVGQSFAVSSFEVELPKALAVEIVGVHCFTSSSHSLSVLAPRTARLSERLPAMLSMYPELQKSGVEFDGLSVGGFAAERKFPRESDAHAGDNRERVNYFNGLIVSQYGVTDPAQGHFGAHLPFEADPFAQIESGA
jgi:hypothetical protein